MRRYNYDHRLATGTIAAGGTLGILIPPSTAFVIYGILTEQSIGRLLLAGILPGLLLTAHLHDHGRDLDALSAGLRPARARAPTGTSAAAACCGAGPMMIVVLVSIGGIYARRLHARRGGGDRRLSRLRSTRCGAGRSAAASLPRSCVETVHTTALVFLILIGALVFGPFLALSGLPEQHRQAARRPRRCPASSILILILSSTSCSAPSSRASRCWC